MRASFRRLRGSTYVAVIADEAAFWHSDEVVANPDIEIINAVRPGLATTGGPLIIASSPYARKGILWDAFRRVRQYAGHLGAGPDKDTNGLPRVSLELGLELSPYLSPR